MWFEGSLKNSYLRLRECASIEANDVFLWFGLLIIGTGMGHPLVSIFLLANVYSLNVLLKFLTRRELRTIYAISVFMLGVVLHEHLNAFFFIAGLYVVEFVFNVFLRFTLRPIYMQLPIGLELVLFNTVLVGYTFGPIAGIITGLLFGTTYYGVIFNFGSVYQFINIPTYALIGYLAGTLAMSSFFAMGMMLAVGYALFTSTFIFLFMGGKLSKCLIFIVSNIMFNFLLFSNVGTIILNMMV